MATHDWLGLKKELPHRRKVVLMSLSFLIPLALWCALSYILWLWHPLVHVTDVGSVDYFVT
jgi:NitT/TauT family transport system permease protein